MDSQRSEDSYILKRDYNASTRLVASHLLWKASLGYLIHPSIPIPSEPRIADVATGNGYWLLDLFSSLKKPYTLEGFDISLDQVPATASNVQFHTWDIIQDPPAEFVGVFDIVHIRLITVVVRDNDPLPIIESLKKLLKPGGFLQWEEVDNTNCTVHGENSPALNKLLAQLAGSSKGDWKQNAANILQNNGFSSAEQFHIMPEMAHAKYWTDLYMSTWAEFVSKVKKDPAQAASLGEEAMKEVRSGAVINCPMWVWIAQKSHG